VAATHVMQFSKNRPGGRYSFVRGRNCGADASAMVYRRRGVIYHREYIRTRRLPPWPSDARPSTGATGATGATGRRQVTSGSTFLRRLPAGWRASAASRTTAIGFSSRPGRRCLIGEHRSGHRMPLGFEESPPVNSTGLSTGTVGNSPEPNAARRARTTSFVKRLDDRRGADHRQVKRGWSKWATRVARSRSSTSRNW
jgi:hypothetical protein